MSFFNKMYGNIASDSILSNLNSFSFENNHPQPLLCKEGSFLSQNIPKYSNAQRSVINESEELQASFEPPAKNWLPTRAKAYTIAVLRIGYENRKETGWAFVKALFERSASSALT